jgi:pyruvate formate lyase activating enzyme
MMIRPDAATAPLPTVDRATVFNIQRCSVHDGPGIRTTVFLKGCPLRCSWCHNPESSTDRPELAVAPDRCVVCGACDYVCPSASPDRAARGPGWDDGTCIDCGTCTDFCPSGARELVGQVRLVAELVDELERDRSFFSSSGGGVTFSGGEPLSQPIFLTECLETCRERGLHTAVDTCGFASTGVVRRIAKLTDLVLFDLKHMDPEEHERHTGTDNRLILENLRALSDTDVEIWIRFPLIPEVNDGEANLDAMASFVDTLPRRHPLFVLPYHATGVAKRGRIAREPQNGDFRRPTELELAAVVGRFRDRGLEVHAGGAHE